MAYAFGPDPRSNMQNYAAQQNTQNAYGGLGQAFGMSSGITWTDSTAAAGVTMSLEQYKLITGQMVIGQNPMRHEKPKKKDVCKSGCSILHTLRQEIDEWHGDILRAA